MKATLNYGLNFITHVDCGREVSKEAHKVLIEKNLNFGFLLLASEMRMISSGKHGEANGNIRNLR